MKKWEGGGAIKKIYSPAKIIFTISEILVHMLFTQDYDVFVDFPLNPSLPPPPFFSPLIFFKGANTDLSHHCHKKKLFRSEAPLQLNLSVCLSVCRSVCLSVCTPLALLYMEIDYIIHNDSILFLGNKPPLPSHPFPSPLKATKKNIFWATLVCSP